MSEPIYVNEVFELLPEVYKCWMFATEIKYNQLLDKGYVEKEDIGKSVDREIFIVDIKNKTFVVTHKHAI